MINASIYYIGNNIIDFYTSSIANNIIVGLVEINRSRARVSVDKVRIIYCNIVSSGKIKYASRQNLIKLPTRDVVLVIYSGTRLMVTSRRRCSKSECPNTNRMRVASGG